MTHGPGADFPWVFGQTYEHLLLVHWPVPSDRLRQIVPPGMNLVPFEGETFIGHDVYRGTHSHLRGLPAIPGFDTRSVVTLRTVVEVGGVRGLYLISLDAPGPFTWFEQHLLDLTSRAATVDIVAGPPGPAGGGRPGEIGVVPEGDDGIVRVQSSRKAQEGVGLRASYRAVGPVSSPPENSRDWFLLGGSRVYTADAGGRMHAIDVEHGPWALAPAEVTIDWDSIPSAAGLPGPAGRVVAVTQRSQQSYAAAPRPL